MAKRRNPRGCQLTRGFILGSLYAQGKILTTRRIRQDLRVSRATAKRDMKVIRTIVPVMPSKPISCLRVHQAQRTIGTSSEGGE